MKKILSILLICIILLNSIPIVVSATNSEDYKTVKVEYSDNRGNPEKLKLMVKDGNVYANAESLATRLGYTFSSVENDIVIKNTDNDSIPKMLVIFSYENTTVKKMIFTKMSKKYEAPFKSIKNANGYWIPFEYSLLLLNSGMLIIDDCILIDMPNKNIIDCFNDILKKRNDYNFEWNKDFGYENIDVGILTADSHLINMFSGILDFEGYSWAELFQSFIMDSSSYDARYGEDLALLICTESDEELNATVDSMNLMIDMFDADGELGELLTTRSTNLDNSVEMYYEMCNNALKDLKTGNSSTAMYNRTYREFEKALDKQTWFSETGGKIIDIQNGISDATRALNVISKLTELVGYGEEFTKQDKFALSALKKYLNSSNSNADIPKAMSDSMKNYSEKLSENIATYSIKRFWDENKDDLIKDVASVGEGLGTQANVALFVWNIASNVVPFISNGLDSADKFELAMYSQIFQSDAFLNYLSVRDNTFNDIDNITPEKLYFVSQYCYIYLKSCYTTRNAALGSLCGKSDSTKNNIKPLIEYQNDINKSIAKTMNVMKNANTTNDDNVYGFLPSDNQKYLDEFDNSHLIDFLQSNNDNVSDDDIYATYLKIVEDLISKHGEARLSQENYYIGLSIVRLIDFDGDGKEELYCVYPENNDMYANTQEIYVYNNGKAVSIFKGNVCNYGTSVDPFVEYLVNKENTYLLTEYSLNTEYEQGVWSKLQKDSLNKCFSYYSNDSIHSHSNDNLSYTVNGKNMSKSEYKSCIESFMSSGTDNKLFLFDFEDQNILEDTKKTLERLGYKNQKTDNAEWKKLYKSKLKECMTEF